MKKIDTIYYQEKDAHANGLDSFVSIHFPVTDVEVNEMGALEDGKHLYPGPQRCYAKSYEEALEFLSNLAFEKKRVRPQKGE